MYRIYLIVLLCVFRLTASSGQGVIEYLGLRSSSTESTFFTFLKIAEDDNDLLKVIMVKYALAEFYLQRYDFIKAEQVLFETLDMVEKYPPAKRNSFALLSIYDIYDLLGRYYFLTGDYSKAEGYYLQSEEKRNRYYSSRSYFKLENYKNLAEFYFWRNTFDKAEYYLEKLIDNVLHTPSTRLGLPMYESEYLRMKTHIYLARGEVHKAFIYNKQTILSMGKFDILVKGAGYQNAVDNIYKPNGTKADFSFYFDLAKCYLGNGEYDKTIRALETAQIRKQKDASYYDHLFFNVKGDIIRTTMLAHWANGEYKKSVTVGKDMLSDHLSNLKRNFITFNEREREEFYASVRSDFDLFNNLVVSMDSISEHTDILYDFQLETKALLLSAAVKWNKQLLSNADTILRKKYQEWIFNKNEVANMSFSKKNGENKFQEKADLLEKELSRSLDTTIISPAVAWRNVREALAPGEAAVEIIRVKKFDTIIPAIRAELTAEDSVRYIALIVTRETTEKPDYVLLNNGLQLEGPLLKLYKNAIQFRLSTPQLYEAYWGPIQEKLRGISKVYLSPDGVYTQINVNTLSLDESGKFLFDVIDVSNVTNTKDILRKHVQFTNRYAVLVGNPDFKIDSEKPIIFDDRKRSTRDLSMEKIRDQEFNPLPGTEAEVMEIDRLLKNDGWQVDLLKGNEAAEAKIKSIANPDLLHIATHGFFISQQEGDPMLRSGLILAGAQGENLFDGEDGIFTAFEVNNLNLDSTRLVTLSACETGLGAIKNGEGVYGLQRAFISAGAQNLLMSLWKVDDEATKDLMNLFYKNLGQTNEISQAFRTAQQQLRLKYPDPYYWGAFLLVGK